MKLTNNQLTNSPVLSNVEGPINQYFFVLSCKSCQKTPLHLSRELYKSHLFLQNKANFKITRNDISTYNTYTYGNLIAFFIPKNKAKQSQFKPNFSSKLALFSRNEPNFKPNSVKIGSLYRLTISKSVFRFYSVFFVPRPLLRQIIGFCFTKISRKMA